MGLANANKGNYKEAKYHLNKALSSYLGAHEHSDILKTYLILGFVYDETGDHMNAKSYYNKALDLQLKINGKMNSATAELYYVLGNISIKLYEGDAAKNNYNEALNIRLKIYGEQDKKTADAYLGLAKAYYFLDDLENSKNYYKKTVQLYEELNGKDHPDTIKAIGMLNTVVGRIRLNEFISSIPSARVIRYPGCVIIIR